MHHFIPMPIFKAIGFGIFIVTLRLLIPSVLDEGERTAISFLHGARVSADTASGIAASAASFTHSATSSSSSAGTTPPFALPRAPAIASY